MTAFLTELRFDWQNLGIGLLIFMIIIPLILYFEFKKKQLPRVKFSSLKKLKKTTPSLKVRLRNLPVWLRVLSISLLLTAFAHPYQEREIKDSDKGPQKEMTDEDKTEKKEDDRKKIEVPSEGISIQLLIDRSGSMGIHGRGRRQINFMKFENTLLSKLDVVKIISKRFIKGTKETNELSKDSFFTGRGNDLVGLFTFARYPFIACPLTLRHELLLDYISQLEIVRRRDEDGTYIGYALERAILQIVDARNRANEEDAYNIKSSIIVLITDGSQSIRTEDSNDRHKAMLPSEAAQIALDNQIKIYSIAIAPRVIYDDRGTVVGSADNFSIDEIKTAAEISGGKFFMANTGNALGKIYQEINQLEKSKLPAKKEIEARVERTKERKKMETEKVEYFPFFLWAGLVILLSEILLVNLYFRRIP
jgi:Ca-activated chloride channel homolog